MYFAGLLCRLVEKMYVRHPELHLDIADAEKTSSTITAASGYLYYYRNNYYYCYCYFFFSL